MQALSYYLLLPIIYLVSLLPLSVLHVLSNTIFFLVYRVIGYRRKMTWKNLKNSFPDKSEAELRVIEQDFYRILCDYIIESIKAFSISRKAVMNLGEFKNPEILQPYFDKKQNIIITTGHVGSQEMVNLFMSASPEFEYPIRGVYRRLTNPFFDKKFKEIREKFGSALYSTENSYKIFKDKSTTEPYIVMLVNDQAATPSKAYWTDFLHQETCFFQGAELFARRYQLPVFYMWISRTKRGHFAIEFIPITENPSQEPKDFVTETHARLLEKNILENPPIWLWSHNRWKHRKDGT